MSTVMEIDHCQESSTTINDLPFYCIDEIFKYMNTCKERNILRLVCKQWFKAMEYHYKDECYRVDGDKYSTFSQLTLERQNVTLVFKSVNFKNTKRFWKKNGANIESLYFDKCRLNSILKTDFTANCLNLKSVYLQYQNETSEHFIELLKSCQYINPSVEYVSIDLRSGFESVKKITSLVTAVDKIFAGLRQLEVQNILFKNCSKDELWIELFQFKFMITLKCSPWDTIIFNQSPSNPVFIKSAHVHKETIDLMNFMYYNHQLERLNICCDDTKFVFPEFEALLNKSNLILLHIEATSYVYSDKPTKNNQLVELSLYQNDQNDEDRITINIEYLKSLTNLRILRLNRTSYSDFTIIVRQLNLLEELRIKNSFDIVITKEERRTNITLKHEKLKKLFMPPNFLNDTCTTYDFQNLTKLSMKITLENNVDDNTHVDPLMLISDRNQMEMMRCPRLRCLTIFCYNNILANKVALIIPLYPKLCHLKFKSLNGKLTYSLSPNPDINNEISRELFDQFPQLIDVSLDDNVYLKNTS